MGAFFMWQLFGFGLGAALGLGVAGRGAGNWAVRMLSAAVAGALAVGLLVAWLFGGKDSPAGDVLIAMLPAFVLVVLASAFARAVPWAMRNKGKAAAGALLVIAAAGGAWGLSGSAPEAAGVEAAAAVSVGCDCSAGIVCTGPRGGRYCLRPDGSKKYQP